THTHTHTHNHTHADRHTPGESHMKFHCCVHTCEGRGVRDTNTHIPHTHTPHPHTHTTHTHTHMLTQTHTHTNVGVQARLSPCRAQKCDDSGCVVVINTWGMSTLIGWLLPLCGMVRGGSARGRG